MGDQQTSGDALGSLFDAEGSIHRLVPGECLLAPGEPPEHVWWVLQGKLRSLMELDLCGCEQLLALPEGILFRILPLSAVLAI